MFCFPLQLNPSKMDAGGDACANAEFLLQVLDEISESILMSAEACPKTLRYICQALQRKVDLPVLSFFRLDDP